MSELDTIFATRKPTKQDVIKMLFEASVLAQDFVENADFHDLQLREHDTYLEGGVHPCQLNQYDDDPNTMYVEAADGTMFEITIRKKRS